MKRVLVTGGSGLVGGFIVKTLHAAGWQVTIAGRSQRRHTLSEGIGFRHFELEPGFDHDRLLDGFDALVHAAFQHVTGRYRGGEGRNVKGFWDRNYLATAQLFEAAEKAGIDRVVFLSSRAVYGQQPAGDVLTEETRCRPDTHYGLIKAACESYLADRSLCGASLRVTGVYGQPVAGGDDKWRPLVEMFLTGEPISPRFGTEVHGQDVAAAVKLMLQAPSNVVTGQIFNVSDLALDRRDLLTLVQRLTGSLSTLPEPSNAAPYNIMDTTKLRRLGWRPGGKALLRETVERLCGLSH